jgi:myo-inositol-1(or 4)-monophosphatase
MQPELKDVVNLALHAGRILKGYFGTAIKVHQKGEIDIVTEADHHSENYLIGAIQEKFPGHTIVTEESGLLSAGSDHCWYIDPLDGTVNYAHGLPIFTVSVAYAEGGIVRLGAIVDPMRDECFSAERGKGAWLNGESIQVSSVNSLISSLLVTGFSYDVAKEKENNLANFEYFTMKTQSVRRLGSAALDLAYVAAGRVDGFWELWIHPWDIAAGGLIAEEAGALVTDLHGNPQYFKPPYAMVAANPSIHPQIMDGLR